MDHSQDAPLPAWVQILRPRTNAEAERNRREIEHARAVASIRFSERPERRIAESLAAHREHVAIGAALARLDFDGVQDETQGGLQ
jgi:hypothetical protein